MLVTALCPTFRRPQALLSSIAMWEMQDYDPAKRHLIILDDDNGYRPQYGQTWTLFSLQSRTKSLPEKYEALYKLDGGKADVYILWEDDDTYLPDFVSSHVKCLASNLRLELSKSARVLSDYTGKLAVENAIGRFYNLAFRRSLAERIIKETGSFFPASSQAQFDQAMIFNLHKYALSEADPWLGLSDFQIPYVYRWHSGYPHAQSAMTGPEDTDWYERAAQIFAKPAYMMSVIPKLDSRTREVISELMQKSQPIG